MMMDELIKLLRALARCEHSDTSIAEEAADALEEALKDTERLAFLASEPVIEGFVGVEKYIDDYALDAAEEAGRDEPNEADMLTGFRRLIDAAIEQARGKEAKT